MKFTIEEIIEMIACAVAAKMGGEATEKKPKKEKKGKEPKKSGVDKSLLIEACEALAELVDAKAVKKVLKTFDFKSPKHVEDDQEVIDEVLEAVNDAIEEAKGDEDGDDDGLTTEEVLKNYQKFVKANSKKEGKALLEAAGIKKPDQIESLDEDDLEGLNDDILDELD